MPGLRLIAGTLCISVLLSAPVGASTDKPGGPTRARALKAVGKVKYEVLERLADLSHRATTELSSELRRWHGDQRAPRHAVGSLDDRLTHATCAAQGDATHPLGLLSAALSMPKRGDGVVHRGVDPIVADRPGAACAFVVTPPPKAAEGSSPNRIVRLENVAGDWRWSAGSAAEVGTALDAQHRHVVDMLERRLPFARETIEAQLAGLVSRFGDSHRQRAGQMRDFEPRIAAITDLAIVLHSKQDTDVLAAAMAAPSHAVRAVDPGRDIAAARVEARLRGDTREYLLRLRPPHTKSADRILDWHEL